MSEPNTRYNSNTNNAIIIRSQSNPFIADDAFPAISQFLPSK